MTWMYIKASTQCDGSFLVALCKETSDYFAVFPSPPPKLCVFLRYVMADFILVEAVSEGDGCSGLLLWTAVVYLFSSC